MIKLKTIPKNIKDRFLKDNKSTYSALLYTLKKSTKYNKITDYFFNGLLLDDKKVEDVLIGDIDSLLNAIESIGKIEGTSKSSPQAEFINLYTKFTNRNLGKTLCDKLGIKVCPYCNRSYIHTLEYHSVRPQYDHFFNKVTYPYLAVSLYNLIPSCSICNQAKSDIDTYDSVGMTNDFLYPYKDEYGYDVHFKTEFKGDISYILGKNENFDLTIVNDSYDTHFQQIVEKTIKTLHTKELYCKHKDYILDLIRASQIYNKDYIFNIYIKFPLLFNNISEVQRMVYMNYLDKDQWGERVLAKLTYDIIQEFKS